MQTQVIYRPPIICPHCGVANYFVPAPITAKQLELGIYGDQGGTWPIICKQCGKPLPEPSDLHKYIPPGMIN